MPTLADSHLNVCAVLSQLDKHDEALEHSLLSIVLLQDEFLQIMMRGMKKPLPGMQQKSPSQQDFTNNSQQITDDRMAVLAIAYHNLGVELEHLKRVHKIHCGF